jgi:hypothetical protein
MNSADNTRKQRELIRQAEGLVDAAKDIEGTDRSRYISNGDPQEIVD